MAGKSVMHQYSCRSIPQCSHAACAMQRLLNERAKRGVSEPIVGTEAKKIFEVWRERADQQSRKNQMEASERESGGSVR